MTLKNFRLKSIENCVRRVCICHCQVGNVQRFREYAAQCDVYTLPLLLSSKFFQHSSKFPWIFQRTPFPLQFIQIFGNGNNFFSVESLSNESSSEITQNIFVKRIIITRLKVYWVVCWPQRWETTSTRISDWFILGLSESWNWLPFSFQNVNLIHASSVKFFKICHDHSRQ